MICFPVRLTVLVGLAVSLVPAAASAQRVEQAGVDFAREIVPLLRDNCFRCHEGRDAPAEVRLDLRTQLTGGTGSDPLVVPGNSGASRMIEVVSGADPDVRMPPEGEPLTTEEVSLLSRWIDAGLACDVDVLPERESDGEHWSFQPVRRPGGVQAMHGSESRSGHSPWGRCVHISVLAAGRQPFRNNHSPAISEM